MQLFLNVKTLFLHYLISFSGTTNLCNMTSSSFLMKISCRTTWDRDIGQDISEKVMGILIFLLILNKTSRYGRHIKLFSSSFYIQCSSSWSTWFGWHMFIWEFDRIIQRIENVVIYTERSIDLSLLFSARDTINDKLRLRSANKRLAILWTSSRPRAQPLVSKWVTFFGFLYSPVVARPVDGLLEALNTSFSRSLVMIDF